MQKPSKLIERGVKPSAVVGDSSVDKLVLTMPLIEGGGHLVAIGGWPHNNGDAEREGRVSDQFYWFRDLGSEEAITVQKNIVSKALSSRFRYRSIEFEQLGNQVLTDAAAVLVKELENEVNVSTLELTDLLSGFVRQEYQASSTDAGERGPEGASVH